MLRPLYISIVIAGTVIIVVGMMDSSKLHWRPILPEPAFFQADGIGASHLKSEGPKSCREADSAWT